MDFKLDEIDGFEEENTEPSEELTDNEEFADSQFDDNIDDEESEQAVYEPEELEDDEKHEELEGEEEDDPPSLVVQPRPEIAPFNDQEENNTAYADAVKAYYEGRNYDVAIEKFNQAIKNEKRREKVSGNSDSQNEVIAKSMYWQAEAYVKIQDISNAIKTLNSLIKNCKEHYLTIAAQRRVEILKTKLTT